MTFAQPVGSIHDIRPQLANLRSYWLGWGSGEVDEDLPVYRTGLPFALLNGVLRVRDRSVDAAVASVRQRMDGVPYLWWVGADSDPDVVGQLVAHGATVKSTLPVMAVELSRIAEVDVSGLSISEVIDRPAVTAYVEAYADVFGIPADVVPAVVDAEMGYAAAHSTVARFVGAVDGQVVGTAQLSVSHGVAGVYWVATREAFRKQGIATALTAAALIAGRERGLRVGTLQASRLGQPVYRAMGFETVGELQHVAL